MGEVGPRGPQAVQAPAGLGGRPVCVGAAPALALALFKPPGRAQGLGEAGVLVQARWGSESVVAVPPAGRSPDRASQGVSASPKGASPKAGSANLPAQSRPTES